MQKINASTQKHFMKPLRWLILILFFFQMACTHQQNFQADNLNSLENMSTDDTPPNSDGTGALNHIRIKGLQDIALSLGAQGGLAWASKQINARLEKDRWSLETTYNFNGMMLSHGVLPPVLAEGDNTLHLSDPSTIRIADKTYKIIEQARFATTPPNWRDYLWMSFNQPEIPNRVLLPRNADERDAWKHSVNEGWQKGIEQAYSIFQQNLARLKRDYYGMILYRKLLQERMVSAPYVSRTEMGITGDGTNMNINDQVLRITVLPRLQTNGNNWHAIAVAEDNGPYIQTNEYSNGYYK